MTIPLRAHVIWLGSELPFVHLQAVRSARQNGGFSQVTLHHEAALRGTRAYDALRSEADIELREITADTFAAAPDAAGLRAVFDALTAPAARANVLRLALLYAEGGVYLDADTITLHSFASLCESNDLFCGEEYVVYPAAVRDSRNLGVRAVAEARGALRRVLSAVPHGYRAFDHVARWYPKAANNAVLGAAPRHRLLELMLERVTRMPESQRQARFALGTHLLQWLIATHEHEVRVYPPRYFYPLGPEISAHWFRDTRQLHLDRVLSEDTVCVHWYASVKTRDIVPRMDAGYVRAHAQSQLLSAVIARHMTL